MCVWGGKDMSSRSLLGTTWVVNLQLLSEREWPCGTVPVYHLETSFPDSVFSEPQALAALPLEEAGVRKGEGGQRYITLSRDLATQKAMF